MVNSSETGQRISTGGQFAPPWSSHITLGRACGRFALELAVQINLQRCWWLGLASLAMTSHLLLIFLSALGGAPPATSQLGNCPLIQRRLVGEFIRNKIHKHLRSLRQ